ncbi:beta-ketoacyl-ACP synthase III [Methylocystis parvus]|uniref:Beta-ketoacyl-[acyl-carrier-protein] synthase III n=1 Tax=Methylocystis parvus TaxID=134 RepID=A0A6B8MCR6_9HYPH|nr:beta-ketoacyl-ACP synthase III [Methylocystis parvus]QGM98440.1 ketoacyl-ACP synthase III [Methylocystis parvus]WBK01223.1 ketoacyl-ACP synthase III [Methylocystis parvus OBBP]
MPNAIVLGTGSYAPERVLTNADLEKMVATNGEWIVSRTGIKERHIAADHEATSDLAAAAGRKALEMAGVSGDDVGMIVVCTVTGDTPTPSCASYVQAKIGAPNAFAFDIGAACAGSLYGLVMAEQFIRSGMVRKALVIGAETLSRVVDWTNRETCVLFGDAAGAILLGATEEEGHGVLAATLRTDGTLTGILNIPGGGSRIPISSELAAGTNGKIKMRGREVYKVAVRLLPEVVAETLAKAGLSAADVDHVICHQANQRIIESALDNLGVPREKCWINIDRYGNTSSASMPISLDEANRAGRLKKGDVIAMMAIGAGMTWGGAVLRW